MRLTYLFIWKHPGQLRGVLIRHGLVATQRALPLGRLAREDVTPERRAPEKFSGRALLEALGCTPMCLQLRHD
jgi:hypothetical protein